MSDDLSIITGRQWRQQAEEEPPAIIDRLLPSQALAFIAGEPGVGKSWLLWDLAMSVLSQTPFVGKYAVTTPGRVLVVASEGSRKASIGRAWAIAKGKGLNPDEAIGDNLHLIWRDGFTLTDRMHVAQVRSHVRQHGIKLVLIDTLHGAWGGRENDSDAWGEVMRVGLRPLMQAGATVALVHHTAKQTDGNSGRRVGQLMRGSSAMHGSRDCLLALGKAGDDEHRVRVTVELRDDAPVKPFTFATPTERVGVGDSFSLDWQPVDPEPLTVGDAVRAGILQEVDANPAGVSLNKIARSLSQNRNRVYEEGNRLLAEGVLVRDSQQRLSRKPATLEGVSGVSGADTPGIHPGYTRHDVSEVF